MVKKSELIWVNFQERLIELQKKKKKKKKITHLIRKNGLLHFISYL